jgi:hypothetical protein
MSKMGGRLQHMYDIMISVENNMWNPLSTDLLLSQVFSENVKHAYWGDFHFCCYEMLIVHSSAASEAAVGVPMGVCV